MKVSKQEIKDLQNKIEQAIIDCKKTESPNQKNLFQKHDIAMMKNEFNEMVGLKVY